MKKLAIFFDLDGTLVDCKDLHYEALNKALEMNGIEPISRHDHETKFDGLPTNTKLKMLGIQPDLADKINADKQVLTLELVPMTIRPDREVVEAIKELESKYVVVCVSNSKRNTIQEILNYAGLVKYFNWWISCESVEKPKPHPDIYEFAMKSCETMQIDKYIAVEDNEKGFKSAIAAGLNVLPVLDSSHIRAKHIKNYISIVYPNL